MATHTSTTADPCPCCISCVIGALSCRTRFGTATLCGEPEFTSPSSPAKFYRRTSVTNFAHYFIGDLSCGGCLVGEILFKGTGVSQLSSTTCDYTSKITAEFSDPNDPCGTGYVASAPNKINFGDFVNAFPGSVNVQLCVLYNSPTQAVAFTKPSNGPGCDTLPSCVPAGSSGFARAYTSDQITGTLQDEDTEADAIARLGSGSWSAYQTPGVSCVNPPCCKAAWQLRTTGKVFTYIEAQWRITQTGLIPGHNYKVPMQYWRRTFGVGSYTLFQSFMASGTADSGGLLDISGTVPNSRGFETYAAEGSCP